MAICRDEVLIYMNMPVKKVVLVVAKRSGLRYNLDTVSIMKSAGPRIREHL